MLIYRERSLMDALARLKWILVVVAQDSIRSGAQNARGRDLRTQKFNEHYRYNRYYAIIKCSNGIIAQPTQLKTVVSLGRNNSLNFVANGTQFPYYHFEDQSRWLQCNRYGPDKAKVILTLCRNFDTACR